MPSIRGNRRIPSRRTGWPSASRKRANFKGHGSTRHPCLDSPRPMCRTTASLRPHPLKLALFRQPTRMSREDSSVASEVCTTLRNRSLDNIKLTTLLRHSRQAIYCGGMTMLLAAKPLRARRRMTFYGMCATGTSRPNLYGWFGRRPSFGAPVKSRSLAVPFEGSRQVGVIED